jgi:hypothetical protein
MPRTTRLTRKPYAGNPHVRFDEGEGFLTEPSLLYEYDLKTHAHTPTRPYADLSTVLSDEALAESEALAKVNTPIPRRADTLTAPPLTRPSLRCLLAEMQGSLWLRVSARCRKTL